MTRGPYAAIRTHVSELDLLNQGGDSRTMVDGFVNSVEVVPDSDRSSTNLGLTNRPRCEQGTAATRQSLPYLISIRRIRVPAASKTSAVRITNPGTEIHAGVGSPTTASGPSERGTGTNEFK